MSVRPPRPRRPARRPSRVRDLPIVIVLSTALMAFWLRVALAVFAISDRIAAWRLVDLLTKPVIQLLNVVPFFERQVMGDLTTGDIFAAALVTLGAFFALASLSIQRSPA